MIELTAVSKVVREPDGSVRTLFSDLDLTVHEHERSVAVLGRSGAGKSTLLRLLAGTDVDYGGVYSFAGERLAKSPRAMARHRLRHVGIVTQAYDLLPDRSVAANVVVGCSSRSGARERAEEALDLVGIAHLARKRPGRLSGGEAQRVAIARAIVERPAVVLADEPTGALDEDTEDRVLALFDHLADRGTTFVIATHSDRVAQHCQRRVRLTDRRLVAEVGRPPSHP